MASIPSRLVGRLWGRRSNLASPRIWRRQASPIQFRRSFVSPTAKVQFLPELELEDIGSDSTKAFGFADELDIGQNKQQPKAPSDPSERTNVTKLPRELAPTFPGQFVLDFELWQPKAHRDWPVEFLASGIRRLGLLQRPKGKRDWIVLEENGEEREINKYDITFLWYIPGLEESLVGAEAPASAKPKFTTDELRALRAEVERIRDSMKYTPDQAKEIWSILLAKYGKEDLIDYEDAARLIFARKAETIDPRYYYAAHLWMLKQETMFQPSPRGFRCFTPDVVVEKERYLRAKAEETKARGLFLWKLRHKLQELGKDKKEPPVIVERRPMYDDSKRGARLELNERLRAQDAELRLIEGSPMLGEKAPEGVDLTKWDPKHDAKFLMDIKSYALITDEDTIDARLFSELLYPLGYGERPIDAFELLVDLGIWTIRENPHLLRWDTTPLAFSPAEQEHAVRSITNPIEDKDSARRVDFGDIPAYAVDSANAKEVDDAVSVFTDPEGRDWLYIHVADITRFIEPHSYVDEAARIRGSSIFLPDVTFPMLPDPLVKVSELRSGFPRHALSFGVRVDDAGRVDRYKIIPTILRNIHNITFEEMDQILLNTEATPKLGELIPPALSDRAQEVKRNHYNNMLKLVEFAKKRRHYRIDNGAVMAWYPTADVTVQEHPETGRETASFGKSKNIFQNARGIITEFMLLAGEIAATFLSERHVPVFYQSQPLVKRLAKKSLEQLVKEKAIMAVQAKENHRPFIIRQVDSLKSLGRASLDIHPSKHNRFGLHKYCAVTSPLRRYTDLIVHYQIKSALRKESVPPFTANALYKVVPPVDNRAQAIKGLQKDSVRYWLYNYMESIYKRDPERLFPALILEASSEKANDQCRVYLHEFGIETEAIMTRKMNRGETIDVQIQYISPFYDHLVLREVRGQRYRVDGPM